MRLTPEQVAAFHKVLNHFFDGINYKLFLYGSRTQDFLKGGDIDLLIVTETEGVKLFEKDHLDILVQIKKQSVIGQRRIDLKAITSSQLKTDPFLVSIVDSLIEL